MQKAELVIEIVVIAALVIGGILLLKSPPASVKDEKAPAAKQLTIEEKEKEYEKFIEISSPDGFVNTGGKPITIDSLKGKVVLLDIWTYSCINCQRTIPHLNDWHEKYNREGLEIIGLHTPEFAFEHKLANVVKAVKDFDIKYPVVLDNDYSTWRAWGNQYWPRKYLIDIDGFVVYDHIGEGAYGETEKRIVAALNEKRMREGKSVLGVENSSITSEQNISPRSPETYFGSLRNERLGNGAPRVSGIQSFSKPSLLAPHTLYLDNAWNITPEYAESMGTESKIIYKFRAKNVFLVAESDSEISARILIDGKDIQSGPGSDTQNSHVKIKESRLYKLLELEETEEHTLEIISPKGLRAYAFTFG